MTFGTGSEAQTVTRQRPADASRQLRAEPVMGTVVTLDIRAPLVSDEVVEGAIGVLHDIDCRFSLYRHDSELSRLADGSLSEQDLSADVRWVLAACDDMARQTHGAFDARRHRPDGVVDPSALVKGWAVELAVAELERGGARNLFIGLGGDISTRGEPAPGDSWQVGIRHPKFSDQVAAVLTLRDGAIATSGLYERGAHLHDPRTNLPAVGLQSFSVVGPDLAWADAYATAGFVLGMDGLAWVDQRPGYGALAITLADEVVWTSVIDRHRVGEPVEPGDFSEKSHLDVLS